MSLADYGDIPSGPSESESPSDVESRVESHADTNEPNDAAPAAAEQVHEPAEVSEKSAKNNVPKKGSNVRNRKQLLQHIAKNTRQGIVNIERFRQQLIGMVGARAAECTHAFIAYRPRLERIPPDASTQSYLSCRVTLSTEGRDPELPKRTSHCSCTFPLNDRQCQCQLKSLVTVSAAVNKWIHPWRSNHHHVPQ